MPAKLRWELAFPPGPTGRGTAVQTLAELSFRTSIGGANAATGGTPTGTVVSASGTPANLYDGSTATVYGDTSTNANTIWRAGYIFASPVDIVEVALTTSTVINGPRDFLVRHSDDGINWENMNYTYGVTWASPNQTQAFLTTDNVIDGRMWGPNFGQYRTTHGVETAASIESKHPPHLAYNINGQPNARIAFTGGLYKIQGTTTQLGEPTARIVNLYHQKSGILVRSQVTDDDGLFQFDNIPLDTYSVVGVNPSTTQNSVIYAHVLSVPM